MRTKRFVFLLIAALAGVTATGSVLAFNRGPSTESAVLTVATRDAAIPVMPWIACARGHAYPDLSAVATQRARLATLVAHTYAPSELSHRVMLSHLQGVVAHYAVPPQRAPMLTNQARGSAVTTLCEPSGGVNHVRVLSFSSHNGTATITLQFHVWNETIGLHDGQSFHYKPQATVRLTDSAVKLNGQWLISHRGAPQFLGGRSG